MSASGRPAGLRPPVTSSLGLIVVLNEKLLQEMGDEPALPATGWRLSHSHLRANSKLTSSDQIGTLTQANDKLRIASDLLLLRLMSGVVLV